MRALDVQPKTPCQPVRAVNCIPGTTAVLSHLTLRRIILHVSPLRHWYGGSQRPNTSSTKTGEVSKSLADQHRNARNFTRANKPTSPASDVSFLYPFSSRSTWTAATTRFRVGLRIRVALSWTLSFRRPSMSPRTTRHAIPLIRDVAMQVLETIASFGISDEVHVWSEARRGRRNSEALA